MTNKQDAIKLANELRTYDDPRLYQEADVLMSRAADMIEALSAISEAAQPDDAEYRGYETTNHGLFGIETHYGKQPVQDGDALQDMLDDSRREMEMVREALGVQYEPHQSLFERTLDAIRAIAQSAQPSDKQDPTVQEAMQIALATGEPVKVSKRMTAEWLNKHLDTDHEGDVEAGLGIDQPPSQAVAPAQQYCQCEPTKCQGEGINKCRWHLMGYSPLDKQAPVQAMPSANDARAELYTRLWLKALDKGYDSVEAAIDAAPQPKQEQEREGVIEECAMRAAQQMLTQKIAGDSQQVWNNAVAACMKAIRKLKGSK